MEAHSLKADVLRGPRISLRAVEPRDYAELRRVELSGQLAFRWRHHGTHEPPEVYASSLWADVLFNFLAFRTDNGEPFGIVSGYRPDMVGGHLCLAAARFERGVGLSTEMVAAVAIAIDYAFIGWPFRKVYLETPEYNLGQFLRDGRQSPFEVEARLREHVFLSGSYWDLVILSVSRNRWSEIADTYRRFI